MKINKFFKWLFILTGLIIILISLSTLLISGGINGILDNIVKSYTLLITSISGLILIVIGSIF